MKKIIGLLLVVLLMACVFTACSSDITTDQGSGSATQNKGQNAKLGDYSVEIDSCRLAKDFEGKDVVIVKYKFTNVNNDTATAFYTALDEAVYQNGVGLNEAFILDDSADYSADNQTKEIRKGSSIDVEVAYELNDTTTDIEVEVAELFSFSDDKIIKTFSIAQ